MSFQMIRGFFKDKTNIFLGMLILLSIYLIIQTIQLVFLSGMMIFQSSKGLYVLISNIGIILLTVNALRFTRFSWFAFSGIILWNFVTNFVLTFTYFMIMFFKESLISLLNVRIPNFVLNTRVLSVYISLIVYVFILKLLFSSEVKASFGVNVYGFKNLVGKLLLVMVFEGAIVAVLNWLLFDIVSL